MGAGQLQLPQYRCTERPQCGGGDEACARGVGESRSRSRDCLTAIVAQAIGQTRLMTWLLGIFAGVALLLASIGIYGAVAYSVAQRTTEIGVRMALGAQTRDVLQLVVRQGMAPVVSGLIIGIVATFGLGRLMAAQLYQVSAHNPLLLLAATTLLAITALVACLLPARRATQVNPVEALRTE